MLFDIVTAAHFLHILVGTPREKDGRRPTVVRVKGSWLLKCDSKSSVAPNAEVRLIDKTSYLLFSSADELAIKFYILLLHGRGPQSCFLLRGGLSDHPGNLFELYLLKLILLDLNKRPPPSLLPRHPEISRAERKGEPSKIETVSAALKQTSDCENSLLTPVSIPEDPHGVLKESHSAMSLLDNSSIVVQRQLEMMNVLMGFEQADRYVIMDPQSQSYWLSGRASAWHRERLYMSNFSYP